MPPDQPESVPSAAGFDATFSAVPASPGLRKVWQLAMPGLQDEARHRLRLAGLSRRVVITTTTPA